ncbi:MAG: hypothetical protein RL220_558 [Bacteroidota bacterium]|jgi:hypothetical protein
MTGYRAEIWTVCLNMGWRPIVLIIALAIPFLMQESVFISFLIDRDNIAIERCVSRDVPGSCCKGTCVLKESMEPFADENSAPSILPGRVEFIFIIDWCEVKLFSEAGIGYFMKFIPKDWKFLFHPDTWHPPLLRPAIV